MEEIVSLTPGALLIIRFLNLKEAVLQRDRSCGSYELKTVQIEAEDISAIEAQLYWVS